MAKERHSYFAVDLGIRYFISCVGRPSFRTAAAVCYIPFLDDSQSMCGEIEAPYHICRKTCRKQARVYFLPTVPSAILIAQLLC